jgi:hypothetical protein
MPISPIKFINYFTLKRSLSIFSAVFHHKNENNRSLCVQSSQSPLHSSLTGILKITQVNVLQLSLLHSRAHKILHILSTPKQLIRVTIFVSCHSCDSSLGISDQECVNSSVGLRPGRRPDLSNYALF